MDSFDRDNIHTTTDFLLAIPDLVEDHNEMALDELRSIAYDWVNETDERAALESMVDLAKELLWERSR